jgi:molybdopterin converting factor subunit 1
MRITVKLFAMLRERVGLPEVTLELPDGATVASAAEALVKLYPAISAPMAHVAYAVNRCYAKVATPLSAGDELAVIPPVSGG